jgi:nitroreductase
MFIKPSVFIMAFVVALGSSGFGQERAQPVPGAKSSISYTKEQEYLFDVFRTRRSVRRFRPSPIPREHILKILDIAHLAPTAGNEQPWKFLVIQDRTKLDQLETACVSFVLQEYQERRPLADTEVGKIKKDLIKNLEGYLAAPVFIVVLTDSNSRYPAYNVKDGSLAAGYLMIAARALGYGSVFCTDTFPFNVVKEVFHIPARYDVICCIPIGVPEAWPPRPAKKSLDEVIVLEKF